MECFKFQCSQLLLIQHLMKKQQFQYKVGIDFSAVLHFSDITQQHQHIETKKYIRKRKDCPIRGCHSKGLLQLSEHLMHVHKIKNKVVRSKWLHKAKELEAC